jgi:hypothetical protein
VLWREPPRVATTVPTDGRAQLWTEAVDFADLDGTEAGAAWQIVVDVSDPYAAPMRALRLLVNRAHPTVERLLSGVDDDATNSVQSVLRWDVARRLLEVALNDDDLIEGFGEYPTDSVGGVLQALLASCLPDASPQELKRMRAESPERFESLLQARLQLLRPA